MAHLWQKSDVGWCAKELTVSALNPTAVVASAAHDSHPQGTIAPTAFIVPVTVAFANAWALISKAGVDTCVNGVPVAAGLHVLADRDEIRINDEVQYFSTESLAVVVPLPATERAIYCARCRLEIKVGMPCVCCPSCGVWYHEQPDLRCFTYTERCAICPQKTTLDAEYAWMPEAE